MRRLQTALGLAFLAIAGATSMTSTVISAQAAESTYVACNKYGGCWRVHRVYAYGEDRPITYRSSEWYDTHRSDKDVYWLPDPPDDRGYYDPDRHWHPDPAARAVQGGITGAGLGAAIGCIVTLPIGCAPGAAVGAAVGGGAGAVGGAASTPRR
jgi:hypothetical protein